MGYTLFPPVYILGTNSVGTLFSTYIYTGEKECGVHSFPPCIYTGSKQCGHTLFPPVYILGTNSVVTLFSPLYIRECGLHSYTYYIYIYIYREPVVWSHVTLAHICDTETIHCHSLHMSSDQTSP